ncbi:hypothetical protein [Nocardia wallacei]|uniref:hypothetical protein n=1 Tax=Nocardia wallacei TaxID=480035 RepID=UPI0024542269|nr:hypothetical protein [Nocardia wallacei]
MLVIIALIIGILIGAVVVGVIAMAAMNGRVPGGGGRGHSFAARQLLRRSHPEDNAASRDLNENAGGSRHIRTNPSWRDRLE